MPVALRRRLYCHYCGKKSTQTNLRKFQCEHCLAVNYLDANGEITDPPAEATCAPTRYATPQAVPTNTVFCATCLKNQDIVARLVAEYVPDEDDPGYDAAIAGLSAYRQRLEQNYPQCCSNCEPRARAQLQQATTAAKSDNMLRALQKARSNRAHASIDWRPTLFRAAGLGYGFSILVQLVWHLLGAQGGMRPTYRNPVQCLVGWPAPQRCVDETTSMLPFAVILGFLCGWWNPRFSEKLKFKDGRLVGLGRYFAIQGVILVLRMASWILLNDVLANQRLKSMFHTISLLLLGTLTGLGLFSVHLDTAPRINWNYEPPRLVSETQFVPPPVQDVPTFPIHHLAGPRQEDLRPWRPPSLVEDEDAMDWAPSHNFQPRQPKPKVIAPSPFYGKLPTLSGGLQKQEPKQSIGLAPGFFDRRDPLPQKSAPLPGLAEPKFFPQSIDTGLESMFDQVFSLGGESKPLRASRRTQASTARLAGFATHHDPLVPDNALAEEYSALPLFSAVVLFLLLGLWMASEHLLIAIPDLRLYLLGCAALPPALRILKPAVMPSVIFLVETIAVVTLAAMVSSFEGDAYLKIGAASLASLIIQELFLFSQQGSFQGSYQAVEQPQTDVPIVRPQSTAPAFEPQPRSAPTPNNAPRYRASVESISSDHSTSTTSTAPDWKTPRPTRSYNARRESNFGLSGLRL